MSEKPIAFVDLAAQRRRLEGRIEAAVKRVIGHGRFIMGPEVAEFERRLGAYSGAAQAVTCASGTDALTLALMALGCGAGEAVFVPGFTFAASAEAAALLGATPVFVDVEAESFNMDPASLAAAVEEAKRTGLRPKAVIPVDLFGRPADYDAIAAVAEDAAMSVVADAAQSFGARYRGRAVGTLGRLAATSFFPSKPLGCYGDGGALLTDDADLASIVRSLRVHGMGEHKYDTRRIGVNSRLDTLQAAVLLEKLAVFDEEIKARQTIAARYGEVLKGVVRTPSVVNEVTSAWACYTVLVENGDRDQVAARLKEAGVPTAVYYPKSLHRQPAYADFPAAPEGLPVADRLAGQVLSLPMHPYLDAETQDRIAQALRQAIS
jgi:dTDP-4-amino-4,6-dideoxygalactose transaminase